jgi:hypothetical protein
MPANDKRANRISKPTKIPKSIKTMDDLLAKSDIKEMIDDLIKNKSNIKDLIIIAVTDDKGYDYAISNRMTNALVCWYLRDLELDLHTKADKEND